MKIFIPHVSWEGDFGRYFKNSFEAQETEVFSNTNRFDKSFLLRISKLRSICQIQKAEAKYYVKKYGDSVLEQCIAAKPDVIIVNNESSLSPEIISLMKAKCNCLMVLLLGDDPWDSIRWKCDFPHSLKYYDIIFSADPSWNNNIRKVAPVAKIYWHCGGYDPERFYPNDLQSISVEERISLSCDLAFTGSSYGEKAEGAYRSDLLSCLSEYNLKIWGGDNWGYRFKFNPELRKHFMGEKLSFAHLRMLYGMTKIFLNLPAPQICFGFQPRLFEIAGCKGFQIADNRLLLKYMFDDDELVTFDSIGELKEKINYYLAHDDERQCIANKLYKRVKSQYTWCNWAERVLRVINTGDGVRDLDLSLLKNSNDELRDLLKNS